MSLRTRLPILGPWLRRRAARKLAEDGSPQAARALAEAAAGVGDGQAVLEAQEALPALTRPESVDVVCGCWAETRAEPLAQVIRAQGWVARAPAQTRVLTGLLTGQTAPLTRGGLELANCLLTVLQDAQPTLAARAQTCLTGLQNQDAIDAVCQAWAASRTDILTQIITEAGYLAAQPLELRVLTLLHANKNPEEHAHSPIPALLHACADPDPALAARARAALLALQDPENQDALCGQFIRHGQPLARDLALRAGFAPRGHYQRALFYFLAEQWEKYEALDFDYTLLSAAYEFAEDALRKRMAQTARRAGRIAWVETIAGRRQRHLDEMTALEWETALQVLTEGNRWDELWELAQRAPAAWSAPMLQKLRGAGWVAPPQDAPLFDELHPLAAQCPSEPVAVPSVTHARTFHPASGEAYCLTVSPDGGTLAAGTARWTAHLWDLATGEETHTLEGEWGWSSINSLVFARSGAMLVVGTWQGLWGWPLPGPAEPLDFEGHTRPVICLAHHPARDLLASGSQDKTIRLWDVPSGLTRAALFGHQAAVGTLIFNFSGNCLASGDDNGDIHLWDAQTGDLLAALPGHHDMITGLAFTPNGQMLASSSRDGTLRLWELPEGDAARATLHRALDAHAASVTTLALSPDGNTLATGGADFNVRLWRLPDGRPLRTLQAHAEPITQLVFSPDGRLLASGDRGRERNLHVWQLPNGEPLGALSGHTDRISALQFTPDGTALVSASRDGSIRLWRPHPARHLHRPPADLTPEDIEEIQAYLRGAPPAHERDWLEFLLAILHARHRYDIEIDEGFETITVGAFDIEIEGD